MVADTLKPDMAVRHQEILAQLGRQGFVSIGRLAESFRVSEQTVRRDLKLLARRGLVTKYHGGAGLPPGPSDVGYDRRKGRFASEKRQVARLVAARIPERATIFIDIGTTMEAVAEALLDHKRLTVVTNHLNVATILNRRADFQVILAGGLVRHNDHATTGDATRRFLEQFRVGYGIFGIGAIDADGNLLDYDFRDIGVSATAMEISRRRFVALDHSKFGADAMVRVAHASAIDAIFTDSAPPPALAAVLRTSNVEVVTPASLRKTSAEVVPDAAATRDG